MAEWLELLTPIHKGSLIQIPLTSRFFASKSISKILYNMVKSVVKLVGYQFGLERGITIVFRTFECPFFNHRSLHAKNFCYDITNTSAVIYRVERGV